MRTEEVKAAGTSISITKSDCLPMRDGDLHDFGTTTHAAVTQEPQPHSTAHTTFNQEPLPQSTTHHTTVNQGSLPHTTPHTTVNQGPLPHTTTHHTTNNQRPLPLATTHNTTVNHSLPHTTQSTTVTQEPIPHTTTHTALTQQPLPLKTVTHQPDTTHDSCSSRSNRHRKKKLTHDPKIEIKLSDPMHRWVTQDPIEFSSLSTLEDDLSNSRSTQESLFVKGIMSARQTNAALGDDSRHSTPVMESTRVPGSGSGRADSGFVAVDGGTASVDELINSVDLLD